MECNSNGCSCKKPGNEKLTFEQVVDSQDMAEEIAHIRKERGCSLHAARDEYIFRRMFHEIDKLQDSDELKDVLKALTVWIYKGA